jgi:hypothetical protein
VRKNWARATNGLRPTTQRLVTNSAESTCCVAAFVVNSEPNTGARPSVRVCVGPELARCVDPMRVSKFPTKATTL